MRALLWDYVRSRLPILALAASWTGIFALLLFLYRLPTEGALYGGLLCLLIGAGFFVIGFARYVRRVRTLEALSRADTPGPEALPAPKDAAERRYQALLMRQAGQLRAQKAEQVRGRAELADYYALWTHQIKTPISAMELILQREDTPAAHALRGQLLSVSQYADMAMAYVRVTQDTSDFLIAPCPVQNIVHKTLRRLGPLFILKDLHLETGPLDGDVLTDEKWACFALEQVLTNAAKYTPAGGRVTVAFSEGRLTVQDTGAGVAAEDLPRVFEKGYTGHNGRADQRASGIGLYLTDKVLRRLNHTISLASEPGKGTLVTIDLSSHPLQPI